MKKTAFMTFVTRQRLARQERDEIDISQNGHPVTSGLRRLLKSQRSRTKQLVAMNEASGNALLVE